MIELSTVEEALLSRPNPCILIWAHRHGREEKKRGSGIKKSRQAIELSSKKEIVTHYILQKELFVEHWNGGQYHCGINVVLIPSLTCT